jgi:hypothetical protein
VLFSDLGPPQYIIREEIVIMNENIAKRYSSEVRYSAYSDSPVQDTDVG